MIRALLLALTLVASTALAASPEPTESIRPDDPFWHELATRVAQQRATMVSFSERRWFRFRKEPVLLTGEARISAEHGLSLHYRTPEPRTVIMDRSGLLIRDREGENVTPTGDPRATAINEAMLHILRLDFSALAKDFVVLGAHAGDEWAIALTPRAPELRQAIGHISVTGIRAAVTHIELRHSAKQRVEIDLSQPLPVPLFSVDDIKHYFR